MKHASLAYSLSLLAAISCGPSSSTPVPTTPTPVPAAELRHPSEVHLGSIKQLTYDSGENAEAYWSHDGANLIFQTTRPPHKCDQIMSVPADGSAAPTLVSTGKGRTTCPYYMAGDQRVVWSSTHMASDECPPTPDRSQGYVWPLYPSFDIFTSKPDGTDLVQLTTDVAYDAEATVCPVDGSIIFTSTRDGDLDLYRMDADGKNVVRLTNTLGYDGGAFFSRDCKHIVWRASRPTGEALADYQRLLTQNLVRPSKLEIFVADADGKNARQVTYLGAASFAPYFHPSNKKILFSTNYPNPRGREFDIYSVNVDGGGLERVTFSEGFDGFPMFSPDGTKLAFASNRNQANDGETDVFVADWIESTAGESVRTTADTFSEEVAWLADDARSGRGVGTDGLEASAAWIEAKLKEAGAGPGNGDAFRQSLEVPVSIVVTPKTTLAINGQRAGLSDFTAAAFSENATVRAKTVFVGYGISAPDLGYDDYQSARLRSRLKGKIAVIRRFVPDAPAFKKTDVERRYSDLYYKAFLAREKGAVGVIFVDAPPPSTDAKAKPPAEAPLPELTLARLKNVGIPAVVASRSVALKLTTASLSVTLTVELLAKTAKTDNVVAVVRAGAPSVLPGVIVVGAHYDHLGLGGDSSLEPGVRAPHNGADDNASGVAGLLVAARALSKNRAQLSRDVYLVAFTAEEMGLLGSSHFVKALPNKIVAADIVAMLNMDMIGRLRNNELAVLGSETATEWKALVAAACNEERVGCSQSGGGYGPSDQTPFYAAGVPVLHFFTGAHGEYHKTTDDSGTINAAGGARVGAIVARVAQAVAARDGKLTYTRVAAPLPMGDRRSWGASLGTIPDYADKGEVPGVLLSGVRPGGPADKAGVTGGDRIVKIGETEVRTVHDLVFVLQAAKPGMRVPIVVLRGSQKMTLKVTFGKSKRRRGR